MKKRVPSLFEWAGGGQSLEALTRRFYEKVAEDPLIGPVFSHMSAAHAAHVAHFIGEVFGGGPLYTLGDGGSHRDMVAHHVGKNLTEQMRKRWMDLLLETADETGLAADPEFRSSVIAYLEWGSRIAVINSTTTENPIDEQAPMPKWGWGETGGPYQPD
ncbi:MAG: globin [Mucilaginibacter polytrichastri]|nr:globin [Mucilaginibacter polytrichastri]